VGHPAGAAHRARHRRRQRARRPVAQLRGHSGSRAARGVDTLALEAAITANNRNDGAGRINEGEEALLVRAEGRIEAPADLEHIVVVVHDGVPIRVADVVSSSGFFTTAAISYGKP
jgi:hypothetical protein